MGSNNKACNSFVASGRLSEKDVTEKDFYPPRRWGHSAMLWNRLLQSLENGSLDCRRALINNCHQYGTIHCFYFSVLQAPPAQVTYGAGCFYSVRGHIGTVSGPTGNIWDLQHIAVNLYIV